MSEVLPYEIDYDKKIGTGTHANVYIGYNKGSDAFAIKKINLFNLSHKHKKLNITELSIVEKLIDNPHPNIVKYHEVIRREEAVYIVMEYCKSGDLHEVISSMEFCEQDAKRYYKQLLEGIKHLHSLNIIHRDLKPKNILLKDNIIKICDFGLAKIQDQTGEEDILCGSPLYMAPEMFNKKTYGYEIDIWASGIILYEILFDENPFKTARDITDLKKILNDKNFEISFPSIYIDTVSKECIKLLKMILCKNTAERITLDDLLEHDWLDIEVFESSKNIIKNIDRYYDCDIFKLE